MDKTEVLLKFAGFTWHPDTNPQSWRYPDGNLVDRDSFRHLLPDLLHSLDAQAKWLWPKLWDYVLTKWPDPHAIVVGGGGTAHTFYDDDPAKACAEAILALIENNGQS